jgi:hypothetical protein
MLRIRELEPADADLLGAMLYAALYWDPAAERLPAELVLAHPRVTIFHEGWGRRLSLRVDRDNRAKRLYARLGYADYEPGDGLDRMILTL